MFVLTLALLMYRKLTVNADKPLHKRRADVTVITLDSFSSTHFLRDLCTTRKCHSEPACSRQACFRVTKLIDCRC